MERASPSSSSTGWEIIPGIQEIKAADVPGVMAGSSCRNKQFTSILEVKADESEYLLRFKDGSEEWVANEELDETTKQFFKLSKPMKRAIHINSRKQIKIEHLWTKRIYKISTSGIKNVQELTKRYTDNAGCNAAIDLYTKDKESDQLILIPPETVLPLGTSKVFARNRPSWESSIEHLHDKKFPTSIAPKSSAIILSSEKDKEERITSNAPKTAIALMRKEQVTAENASAVGGSDGKGIARHDVGAGCGESAPSGMTQNDIGPKIKVSNSVYEKMFTEQKIKLAIEMSQATVDVQGREDALNSKQNLSSEANRLISAFTDIFGSKPNLERTQAIEPESKNLETGILQAAPALSHDSILMDDSKEALVETSLKHSQEVPILKTEADDQEQKPVEEPEEVFDIVIEAESDEKQPQAQSDLDRRPIIHSQPVFDNSPDNFNGWLQSLSNIDGKEELHAAVAEKIVEIEIAHAIKLSEMENRHKVVLSSLKEIIKRQASEKDELLRMMKETKTALLTAIEAQLDEASSKFEHMHQSFFLKRNKQLETLSTNLEKQVLSSSIVGERRKTPIFQELETVQDEKKQSEPLVAEDENSVEVLMVEPEPSILSAPELASCPAKHGVTRVVRYDDMVICNKRGYMAEENTEIFSCRQCNFDICVGCFRNERRNKLPFPQSDTLEWEVSPRGTLVDDDGNDSKEWDDVEARIAEEIEKHSPVEQKAGNIVEDQKDEEEINLVNNKESSLEMVNVRLSKGGFISEPMEVSMEMKNVGAIPIQCLATLTTIVKGDGSNLVFRGFKSSLQEDKKVIRLNLAPGDSFTAVIEFYVPETMKPKTYDFYWQLLLRKSETRPTVGPMFALKNLVLLKPLMPAEEKVRRLCSIGLGTREEVIQALDSNDWNLNLAVNEFLSKINS